MRHAASGKVDCIIPVGGLDREGRATILEHYLATLNTGRIDLDLLVELTIGFTPADIQYLFQQVALAAFEQELASRNDYLVTAATFIDLAPKVLPSLSAEMISEFEKDSINFSRV